LKSKIPQIKSKSKGSDSIDPVIQTAKRKARGYKVKHFKTIAYLLTGNHAESWQNHGVSQLENSMELKTNKKQAAHYQGNRMCCAIRKNNYSLM